MNWLSICTTLSATLVFCQGGEANCMPGPDEQFTMATTAYAAQPVLTGNISPPVDFEKSWDDGWKGRALLAREFSKGGVSEDRATRFVVSKLRAAWAISIISNGHKPFRDVYRDWYARAKGQPETEVIAGKKLLRKASEIVDWEHRGDIPDFFYNWIK